MSFGSLGLFRQLSALGRSVAHGSAADLNKRAKRLPAPAKVEFEELRKLEKAKLDAARAASQRAYDEFFARYYVPRTDYKKERAVVAAFVHEGAQSGAGLESDGFTLKVNGREVASRANVGSKFVQVCPGQFGEDKASRRAANAILDIMGAGVSIHDRGEHAFIDPKGGRGGVMVSPTKCYTVEVNSRVKKAADRARKEFWEKATKKGGELERFESNRVAREYAKDMGIEMPKMQGLRRKHRKSRKSRR